ncbi:MAG: ExbD/TolR family protein [Myxococcota bacterium]
MAGGMDLGTGGVGGKKSLDATINLVPFIDLMAVTISFLIMTAVWTQVGRLEVSQAGAGPTEAPTEPTSPPITLVMSAAGLRLLVGGAEHGVIPMVRDAHGRLDLALLRAKLKGLEGTTITIQAEDSVRYEDLVRVIDECAGSGFPAVSISTA